MSDYAKESMLIPLSLIHYYHCQLVANDFIDDIKESRNEDIEKRLESCRE